MIQRAASATLSCVCLLLCQVVATIVGLRDLPTVAHLGDCWRLWGKFGNHDQASAVLVEAEQLFLRVICIRANRKRPGKFL